MTNTNAALVLGGLAVGGGLLYALTRPKAAPRPTPTPTPPSSKELPPSSKELPTGKLPTGTYWHPYTRAEIGEFDARILELTKGWVWPVEMESVAPFRKPSVSSSYKFRDGKHFRSKRHPNGRWHNGVDIMFRRSRSLAKSDRIEYQQSKWYDMWLDTRAIATAAGRVRVAGQIGTGGRVLINHGNHLHTAYLHLDRIDVKTGDRVKRGQTLGTVGLDGGLYHMHFELWYGFLHKVLDPGPYLKHWGAVAYA